MNSFLAFLKKEWMEWSRSGRIFILLLVFVLFGIMNPAIAKATPWMMEMMAESLEGNGLVVTEVTVDALTSWTQFYKNIPMALIIFVLLCSGSFTSEFQKGTLIPVLTKGLSRWKIVMAKSVMMFISWTACYWICFGITYAYNAFYWDNSIATHAGFAAMCYWLFGLLVLSFMVLFSTLSLSNTTVLLGTGGTVLAFYLIGLLPQLEYATPMELTDSMSILTGLTIPNDYMAPIAISAVLSVICVAAAVKVFKTKRI